MSGILWRMFLAVLAVVFLFLVIPLFFAAIQFPLAAPVWALLRVLIAGLAVFYVFAGKHGPPWP